MAMHVDVKTFRSALAWLALFNCGSCDRDSKTRYSYTPSQRVRVEQSCSRTVTTPSFSLMLVQGSLFLWFCENVRWLFRRVDWEDVHRAACNVHSEVVVLDIYVLGARSHGWRLGQDSSSRVVLRKVYI